ncbi:hypothetical protein CEUSTIGMA_g4379.t1 [Chlamydomonas eustigma]|uniref:J domain-containing protein n=1 Tax=Chlamydomonas eustigma TaxID=1157962 RepID=A0A250X214_9CHLO|nr:hypothetical protein CEUSTIGMA_g4379.t1 [Chlamydomonas eustigma]|eukprot:GAX76932.1 hypothetical protein CEUSTIGMA_g4379.t1 [Chlamydomonas eustigma]
MISHYEVLGISPSSSLQVIKAAYHALLLQLHPDKLISECESEQESRCISSEATFHSIQAAWEILRDDRLRSIHDQELTQADVHTSIMFYDELDLEELSVKENVEDEESGTPCYTHLCRCGDAFYLPVKDVIAVQSSIAVPCRSCSNHILVRVHLSGPPSGNFFKDESVRK